MAVIAATFNPNDYKQQIIDIVKAKKERTLKLDGDIALAFWPSIGANLGKVSLSEHKSDKEFAALEGVVRNMRIRWLNPSSLSPNDHRIP